MCECISPQKRNTARDLKRKKLEMEGNDDKFLKYAVKEGTEADKVTLLAIATYAIVKSSRKIHSKTCVWNNNNNESSKFPDYTGLARIMD